MTFDVIILGSGLAGSVTGTILAKHGARVLLVDAAAHPRFAVGESMTPQLVEWIHIPSERHDIPELKSLASVQASTRDIGPTFGTKAHFGFIKHEVGQEPDPRAATQLALPMIFHQNSHLHRQDSDSFMFHVAIKYGCVPRQNWRASEVDFDADGVTVTGKSAAPGAKAEQYRAKYLVDASGARSPLADKFGLREQPARFKHPRPRRPQGAFRRAGAGPVPGSVVAPDRLLQEDPGHHCGGLREVRGGRARWGRGRRHHLPDAARLARREPRLRLEGREAALHLPVRADDGPLPVLGVDAGPGGDEQRRPGVPARHRQGRLQGPQAPVTRAAHPRHPHERDEYVRSSAIADPHP
ncbi:FAD-dependent monooxygenase [Streptomyces iconiensis]|uniref:FAD-dependent monooxygenase n=2 Tax=Streptomyces iconiensis TaxID=1384038 RepID=A0ABT7A2P5_9ACTN|nr:FAD-dependent monooxygenase [Streptomyces iconiensis]MDJ1135584.1 FAD-dependent monooxygenase [Streptomyces iconiensis]